jgi:hypothetical protein
MGPNSGKLLPLGRSVPTSEPANPKPRLRALPSLPSLPSEAGPLRVLDFDSECRPLHYSEFRREDQITGIAWSWIGEESVECRVLEQDMSNEDSMLSDFLEALNGADMVTGHFLTRHDLPLINDHCLRAERPLLKEVLVQDTVTQFTKIKGLGKSQENLATAFGLSDEKHRMCGAAWRVANTLTAEGQEGTRTRVVSDVRQHKSLRLKLIELGALKMPRVWRP